MFDRFKAWKERRDLKRLIGSMGNLLRRNYGVDEFYTPEQVSRTCDKNGLDETTKARSVAMYSETKLADGFLTKMGRSESANELRKYLIRRCFDNFSEGDDSSYNVFMHASEQPGIAHDNGSFDGDSSGNSGADSGGGHH